MLKKLLSLTICIASTAAIASPKDFTPLTTLAQAQQNCPLPPHINFTADNPSITHSKGAFAGNNQNNMPFKSFNANTQGSDTMAPAQVPANIDFYLSPTDNAYSYISDGTITCFYRYTGFTGITVYVNLRSHHSS